MKPWRESTMAEIDQTVASVLSPCPECEGVGGDVTCYGVRLRCYACGGTGEAKCEVPEEVLVFGSAIGKTEKVTP